MGLEASDVAQCEGVWFTLKTTEKRKRKIVKSTFNPNKNSRDVERTAFVK